MKISRGFWLFDSPCTQALWETVMGSNPSRIPGLHRPVESVSWEDSQEFLTEINGQVVGLTLRLPTEAEWEYACRAGTLGPWYAEDLDRIAWFENNSNQQTHCVKEKQPNGFGLYDMLGNVAEWCHDGPRTYTGESVVDPPASQPPPVTSWSKPTTARSSYGLPQGLPMSLS